MAAVIDTGFSPEARAEVAGGLARLLAERFQAHEKHAWMLRATLGGK